MRDLNEYPNNFEFWDENRCYFTTINQGQGDVRVKVVGVARAYGKISQLDLVEKDGSVVSLHLSQWQPR